MTTGEFADLVFKMRTAQKKYFRTRSQSAMTESKSYEKEVVVELELASKEDNYHYSEDYQKEDLTIMNSELFMLQLMLVI